MQLLLSHQQQDMSPEFPSIHGDGYVPVHLHSLVTITWVTNRRNKPDGCRKAGLRLHGTRESSEAYSRTHILLAQ